MINTIISDMGKVVLHFDNRLFFQKMTRYTKKTIEEIRAETHANAELVESFDMGRITPHDFFERATAKLEAEVSYEDFFAAYCDVFAVNPVPLAVLAALKPKYRLILLSNTDVVRFSHIRKTFPELLIFDGYVLSFDYGMMKPDPRIYLAALGLAGAKPENGVFIDDILANIEGAQKVGLTGILFTEQTDLKAELGTLGVAA